MVRKLPCECGHLMVKHKRSKRHYVDSWENCGVKDCDCKRFFLQHESGKK